MLQRDLGIHLSGTALFHARSIRQLAATLAPQLAARAAKPAHGHLNEVAARPPHVHDGSPLSFSEYQTSETRRRIAPATPSPPCAVRSAA